MFGFSFGFRIHFQGAEWSFEARNLRSALDNPKAVDSKLNKELEAGRLVGPFMSPPLKYSRVSPLGLVPKKQPAWNRIPSSRFRGEIYSRNPSVQTKSEVFEKRFARLAHYLIYAMKNFANVTTIPNERSPMEPVRPAFGAILAFDNTSWARGSHVCIVGCK
jgi:hypothetical protein